MTNDDDDRPAAISTTDAAALAALLRAALAEAAVPRPAPDASQLLPVPPGADLGRVIWDHYWPPTEER